MEYVKFQKLRLKNHPEFNEKWLQQRIAEDPTILGLGELILKDEERLQPHAGRLDLLLQDPESSHRYEVEIQLGKTDESHIIRTIEYWDIERKRYPQYDHTAVLVAEDVTSRFLNVISLFNGFIPLIAIQLNCIKFGDKVSLVATTVLDQMILGLEDDDDSSEPVDRSYWEKRGTKRTLAMADDLLDMIHEFAPDFQFKYNKFYIGLAKDGRANNFASFRPQKKVLFLEVKLAKSEEVETLLEEADIDLLDYSKWGTYRIRLSEGDPKKHADILQKLLKDAYQEFTG